MEADGVGGAFESGAEFGQGQLGVVAGADRLGDGGDACGEKAGKEDGRLHLGAGERQGVVGRVEAAAADVERGEVTAAGADARAHLRERLDDAAHGAAAEGGVAGESGVERLAGEEAGEEAKGGAGVAGVEGAAEKTGRAAEGVKAATGDGNRGRRRCRLFAGSESDHADGDTEPGETVEGAAAVVGGREVLDFGGAVGKGGEQGVTMGDGLVAGHRQGAGDGAGGGDGEGTHGGILAGDRLQVAGDRQERRNCRFEISDFKWGKKEKDSTQRAQRKRSALRREDSTQRRRAQRKADD